MLGYGGFRTRAIVRESDRINRSRWRKRARPGEGGDRPCGPKLRRRRRHRWRRENHVDLAIVLLVVAVFVFAGWQVLT